MRRSEQAITDPAALWAIIRNAEVCRVAMVDGDHPYALPFCFGVIDTTLYLHCANEGRKLDILRVNPRVCVVFDTDNAVLPALEPCRISYRYRSVLAFGRASIVTNHEEKAAGLRAIVRQYTRVEGLMPEAIIARTTVLRIDIEEMTGKQSG
ncbi:MAG: Pyridoxamine 5'-phosphate oxidase [bacterium ADurb.Bin429]|nr:MAG: Pyridoxamine 5'-phosphate oxidase [bacterium ADurb.Bin429]